MALLTALALLAWALASRPARRTPRVVGRRWRAPVRPSRRRDVDVGEFVAEVATRLRSGSAADEAWRRTARRWGLPEGVSDDGVPAALLALPPGPATAGACAAARLAHQLGSPLADMLDGCAAALTQAEANEAARRGALAGPVASARLLATLPAFGLLLGTVVGARPVDQLLGGGVGSVSGLVGVALYALGVRWTVGLVRRARQEASDV